MTWLLSPMETFYWALAGVLLVILFWLIVLLGES